MPVNAKLIEDGAGALSLDLPANAVPRLSRYVAEIELWNAAYGLVNDSGDALITRHILDSLAGAAFIAGLGGKRIADMGSGAGLPGIPLAIVLPDARFDLVEPSERRCRFLESQKAILPLPNADIVQKRIEELKGAWDIVTFRGFRPLEPLIVRRLMGFLSPGGAVVAYKGRKDRIAEELEAIAGLGLDSAVMPLQVPFLDEERNLVVLKRRDGA